MLSEMRRLLLISVLLLSFAPRMAARRIPDRIVYGFEWGASARLLEHHHYNFICNEGYRIDQRGASFDPCMNGFLLAHLGVDLGRSFNLSAVGGYAGMSEDHSCIPLGLRCMYAPRGIHSDGILFSMDGEVGVPLCSDIQGFDHIASLSAGYRLALSRFISLDFKGGIRSSYCHKVLTDPDTSETIKGRDVRRNDAFSHALYLSVALEF